MNVLTIFEQRIGAILEGGAPGEKAPFSFKRLAKRAVREMEDETFVIDGVDTAPALYTILISTADDALMRSMYRQITDELSQLIEAQAKKRGYTFVGRPLVRFMVDPALRHGRYSVFAENIDPRTLARLRDEENAYLGVTPPHQVYPPEPIVPEPVPVHADEPEPVAHEVAFAAEVAPEVVAKVAPDEPMPFEEAGDIDSGAVASVEMGSMEGIDTFDAASSSFEDPAPMVDPLTPADLPMGSHFAGSMPTPASAPEPEPEPEPEPLPSCTLVNLGSGQVFHIDSGYAPIGRERSGGSVVLSDPNVSRRHAELVYDGTSWHIRDLNSTNGTLVNDLDVSEARLFDGDVLTIGLTNLEFRVS